jgi:rhodanese-related sulfurtransferase
MDDAAAYDPADLMRTLGFPGAPLLIDVRRQPAFDAADRMIAGALRRSPDTVADWAATVPVERTVVVYCARGHEVSQTAAAALRTRGVAARYLAGGIEGWSAAGGLTMARQAPVGGVAPSRWVTRERPKIDRIACPWLIRRFIDPQAEFLYVPTGEVDAVAERTGAIPYDVPDVAFSHDGPRCSFDAFIRRFELADPALARLAVIVRGADTARPELAPQAPGLLAVSLGLSALFPDDLVMLEHGITVYDALYAWCRGARDEAHDWRPETMRVSA